MKKINLGIIGSSNGGSLQAFLAILHRYNYPIEFTIITDRDCGLEKISGAKSITRIEESENFAFCRKAASFFDSQEKIDLVVLFFTRFVTKEIYLKWPTINLHESLLPKYPGFHGIERALKNKDKNFGTTMHIVDEGKDTGSILAQASCPIFETDDAASLAKISYIQKVYLLLLLLEAWEQNVSITNLAGHFNFIPKMEVGFYPKLKNEIFAQGVKQLDLDSGAGLFKRLIV